MAAIMASKSRSTFTRGKVLLHMQNITVNLKILKISEFENKGIFYFGYFNLLLFF